MGAQPKPRSGVASLARQDLPSRNLVPRAFSSTIFKMADRREKTLGNAKLTPLVFWAPGHVSS